MTQWAGKQWTEGGVEGKENVDQNRQAKFLFSNPCRLSRCRTLRRGAAIGMGTCRQRHKPQGRKQHSKWGVGHPWGGKAMDGRGMGRDEDKKGQVELPFIHPPCRLGWPEEVPELMAYMIHIIKASQEYEGLAWFMYDEAYRRQAAATGFTEWLKINRSIFTVCFNSRAKSGVRCELCLTLRHDARGCTRTEREMDLALRLRTMEAALGAPHPSSSEGGYHGVIRQQIPANCTMRAGATINYASLGMSAGQTTQ